MSVGLLLSRDFSLCLELLIIFISPLSFEFEKLLSIYG